MFLIINILRRLSLIHDIHSTSVLMPQLLYVRAKMQHTDKILDIVSYRLNEGCCAEDVGVEETVLLS